jgi:CubicO group peptidase (beta-lactamase class C family)
MKLYDEEKVQLTQPLKSLIDIDKGSRLKNIKIRELLTHRSGLQSNMPIARYILDKDSTGNRCTGPFCKEQRGEYSIAVADSFYMNPIYIDSIWQEVFDIKPYRRKRYRYSDVNFNLLMRVIEERGGKSIDEYIKRHFYQPLNLERLSYTPARYFKKRDIVPTAKEDRFRNQLIHGYVHDESAALLGGVAGNAGLFGNTESLAPLMQMLLNRGEYGGRSYLKPKTVDLFTKQQRNSNRAYGFDVKTKNGTNACASEADDATFGHTGFTGTCVWVDPENELIFIFLSNRIYPDVRNRKLFRDKVRSRIHSLVYEALDTYPERPVEEEKEEEIIVRAAVQ